MIIEINVTESSGNVSLHKSGEGGTEEQRAVAHSSGVLSLCCCLIVGEPYSSFIVLPESNFWYKSVQGCVCVCVCVFICVIVYTRVYMVRNEPSV